MADEKCPGGGIGRRAGLKILYAVMRVRVQFPSGALENQIVTKVLAVSKETAFFIPTTILQHCNSHRAQASDLRGFYKWMEKRA